ncbi:hypothetical protein Nepgr_030746 [Nepenthes gracilis]|uniref:Neutral/alkaline non-lysosomal ceramidase N-terminal domain-containing protein n=1 Tax=Nepenthes gracilis TaxID=150966 RepID=A0AAD3Y4J2_NEPGR|nr:hypothetical protein Nepgr_030746 [Nepenthes gracilis]
MKFSQLERQGSSYPVGSFNWFATPGPSMHRAKSLTSGGNKGAILLLKLVRDVLTTTGKEQIDCQGRKPIFLDTGGRKDSVLLIQVLRIGQLAVFNVPANFTTMAGSRHREAESKAFGQLGAGSGGSWKSDARKTLSKIDLAEERVQSVVQKLEAVKSSKMMTLDKLRSLTENASRARASAAQHHSTISISRFEYEYLSGCGAGAKEIANRLVPTAESIPPNGHFVSTFHEEPFSISDTLISTHHEGPIGGMLVEDAGRPKDLRNWCPSAAPIFN